MAGKSKNKYDVYVWIKHNVIPSCKTLDQKRSVDKLIYNFEKVYQDHKLTRDLTLYLIS